jgi:hypothetical protein
MITLPVASTIFAPAGIFTRSVEPTAVILPRSTTRTVLDFGAGDGENGAPAHDDDRGVLGGQGAGRECQQQGCRASVSVAVHWTSTGMDWRKQPTAASLMKTRRGGRGR